MRVWVRVLLALLGLSGSAWADEAVVSTFAGNGRAGLEGDGGDRRQAALLVPVALAWAAPDVLLYLDMGRDLGGRVRRIDLRSGIIETVAGGGQREAEDVPAREARLSRTPSGLAVDSRGNIYIGYEGAGRVDRVDARTGRIARFAGGGAAMEDGVPARALALSMPAAVRVDAADNVYVADWALHVVYRMDAHGATARRVAGTPGMAGYSGDGGPARSARLNRPTDIAWDRSGNLYIADRDNHVIRVVDVRTGSIDTYAGSAGVPGFDGDGGDRRAAVFRYPQSLLVEDGAILVADRLNHRIRRIDATSGLVTTLAGSGRSGHGGENVPALAARLFEPIHMTRTPAGDLLVTAGRARRIYVIGAPVALPVPWWRSPWAIAAYAATLGLLTYAVVRVRTRALRARMSELEAAVAARIRMLVEQRRLVELQARQLNDLIESRDTLLARVAHEFRTPLAVILGATRQARQQTRNGLRAVSVEAIEGHANRLLRLVEQLLDVARLGHEFRHAPSPVSAAPVLRRVVASFESRATERGIALRVGPVDAATVQTTPEAFAAIMGDLVRHAIERARPGSLIEVSLEVCEDTAQVTVAETCATAGPTAREPVSAAHAGAVSDAGLDSSEAANWLTLARQLIAAHGGSIDEEADPAGGQRYTMRLPLITGPLAPASRAGGESALPVAPAAGEPAGLATVLVIEDNPDLREYLHRLLATRYRCFVAADGSQGLGVATAEQVDLVVCDVMLPGQDGFAVCRALKGDERTSHIPVVLLTALGAQQHRRQGFEEGADDYLTKPFDDGTLLQRIANLLEIRAILRQRYARELWLPDASAADLGHRDRAFLERLRVAVVAEHADPDLDVTRLGQRLGIGERHLQRKLRALLDMSPGEYLRNVRLEQALGRLRAGERPSDTALAVGFGSHAHFTRSFKARFGYPPGEARSRFGAAQAPEATVD